MRGRHAWNTIVALKEIKFQFSKESDAWYYCNYDIKLTLAAIKFAIEKMYNYKDIEEWQLKSKL